MQEYTNKKRPNRQNHYCFYVRVLIQSSFLISFCSLGYSSQIHAQAGSFASSYKPLRQEISTLIKQSKLSGKVGVSISDTRSERLIFTHNGNLPLNPASNMKLVTAAVAMWKLGPNFRMRTGLYGKVQGNSIVGGLYLKGFGDPTLTFEDLIVLARKIVAKGIRSVDEVIVDGSYFDSQYLPPAFEQQPEEISPFRAAIGAISVDRNAYNLFVRPGTEVNSQAVAVFDVPGYFQVENEVITTDTGPPKIIAIQNQKDGKLLLKLRGSIPAGVSSLSYSRRVPEPLTYAGYAMAEALRIAHVSVPRRTSRGTTPNGLPLIASQQSKALSEILWALGKYSDNFVAEMIFKVIGAEQVRTPGRSADGARTALSVLRKIGVPTDKISIINGSGLFTGNKIATSHLAKLLTKVHNDASIRSDFLAHLAVGGADGTLSRRLRDLPAPRIVRAKTGTLKNVVALSGYVIGPMPERVMAFSFIANQLEGKHQPAKELADNIAIAIANHLWKN